MRHIPTNSLAKQTGFKLEGMLRWNCMMEGYQKVGKEAREGDVGDDLLGRIREILERAFTRMV